MNWKRFLNRSFFYFENGYRLMGYPLSVITFSTTVYYLLINNIIFLKEIFPEFRYFISTVIMLIPISIFIGYVYIKKLAWYREIFEISKERNPYMLYKISPVQFPLTESLIELLKMHDIDTSKIEKQLEESRK